MKKCILLSVILCGVCMTLTAQDDMYFVPSKAKAQLQKSRVEPIDHHTYYAGTDRDVDEYNRMGGSSYEPLQPDTGDIISFAPVQGVYPDSTQDFSLTRQMVRWDGYEPSVAYDEGYRQGRRDALSTWHSPWFYSSYYPWYWYDPWYYDPWYYSSWEWHDPWYYGGWGWRIHYGWGYGPRFYGVWYSDGGYVHNYRRGYTANYRSRPHGTGSGRYTSSTGGTRRGSRFGTSAGSREYGVSGTRRSTVGNSVAGSTRQRTSSRVNSGYSDYSGPRSVGSRPTGGSGSSYTPSSSGSSGSFGGSRGGGGFSGGGSRGGGSFGGGGGSRSGSSRR